MNRKSVKAKFRAFLVEANRAHRGATMTVEQRNAIRALIAAWNDASKDIATIFAMTNAHCAVPSALDEDLEPLWKDYLACLVKLHARTM